MLGSLATRAPQKARVGTEGHVFRSAIQATRGEKPALPPGQFESELGRVKEPSAFEDIGGFAHDLGGVRSLPGGDIERFENLHLPKLLGCITMDGMFRKLLLDLDDFAALGD